MVSDTDTPKSSARWEIVKKGTVPNYTFLPILVEDVGGTGGGDAGAADGVVL
jgi:hypothetical protein